MKTVITEDDVINMNNILEGDPIVLKEFRNRIAQRGLGTDRKMWLHYEGHKISVWDYPPSIRLPGMVGFFFKDLQSAEAQYERNLKNVSKGKSMTPKVRYLGEMSDDFANDLSSQGLL